MADFSFQFFVNDFEGGTTHMTDAEVGCYLRLLLAQFRRGYIPDNPDFLRRFSDSFDKSWPMVKEKFTKEDDGTLANPKMKTERAKRHAYSASRSKNRQKKKEDTNNTSNSHQKHKNNISVSYENHMDNDNDNDSSSIKNGADFTNSIKLKPVGLNDPIVPAMLKIIKKYDPDYEDMDSDFSSCRMIAGRICKAKGWGINSFENENKKETLEYFELLIIWKNQDSFFRPKQLSNILSQWQNFHSSYKQSLKIKLNRNGKHSGISATDGETIEFD